jgi:PPOX class probable F420-dependent enzyme
VRKNLSIEELGDLVELPLLAVLATYRRDGSVLLSPVWHEWRDGGFSIIVNDDDVKLRHIERQGRAVAVVADNDFPFRGVEVSCSPIIERDPDSAQGTFERIARRYLGEAAARRYVEASNENMIVIRMVPGDGQLRTWDFADDGEKFGQSGA